MALFKANITAKTVRDPEALATELYIFLRDYVPTRLVYEDHDNHQDCIQDTMMFMIQRYAELDKEMREEDPLLLIDFNYEKYFYNRARGYISYWIRKVQRDRHLKQEYMESVIYFGGHQTEFVDDLIDYVLLESIVLEYSLGSGDTRELLKVVERMLADVGFTSIHNYGPQDKERYKEYLWQLGHAILDEYLLESNKVGE